MPHPNSKGPDEQWHLCSLIWTFFVDLYYSIHKFCKQTMKARCFATCHSKGKICLGAMLFAIVNVGLVTAKASLVSSIAVCHSKGESKSEALWIVIAKSGQQLAFCHI